VRVVSIFSMMLSKPIPFSSNPMTTYTRSGKLRPSRCSRHTHEGGAAQHLRIMVKLQATRGLAARCSFVDGLKLTRQHRAASPGSGHLSKLGHTRSIDPWTVAGR
jgi:hypothetical protein